MLPKDGAERIAQSLGVHVSTVSRALNGKNEIRVKEVVFKALEIINEEKQIITNLENFITNL